MMELKFILNGIGTSPMKELTINTNDKIGKEKHQNYQQIPTNDLHNPSTMVPPIYNVFLSLNSNPHEENIVKGISYLIAKLNNKPSLCSYFIIIIWIIAMESFDIS